MELIFEGSLVGESQKMNQIRPLIFMHLVLLDFLFFLMIYGGDDIISTDFHKRIQLFTPSNEYPSFYLRGRIPL